MKDTAKKRIWDAFLDSNGIADSTYLVSRGIHTSQIKELLQEGRISKLKRGLYMWPEILEEENQQYLISSQIVPRGVICLQTALAYHGLITENPWEITMAVPRNYKVSLPAYPPIKLYTFGQAAYQLGVQSITSGRLNFKIFNKEKCICDAVKLSKRIGSGMATEAMRNYLSGSARDIDLMMRYAKEMKIEEKVRFGVELLT